MLLLCCLLAASVTHGYATAPAFDGTILMSLKTKVYPGCTTSFTFKGYFDRTGKAITSPVMGSEVRAVVTVSGLVIFNLADSIQDAINDRCSLNLIPPMSLTTDMYVDMLYTGLAEPKKICYPFIPVTESMTAKAVACASVCRHRDTTDAITSRDACRLGPNSLAGKTWGAMMMGLNLDSLVLPQLLQSPVLGPCLLQYMGKANLKSNSTCVRTIGDFCYRGMCVSNIARARGFTNEDAQSGYPHIHCAVDSSALQNTKGASYRSKLNNVTAGSCDVCVLRTVVMSSPYNGSWVSEDDKKILALMMTNCPTSYISFSASSTTWSDIVTVGENKANVIKNAVELMTTYNMNGIIFEYTFPQSQDSLSEAHTQFIIETKTTLVTQNIKDPYLGVMTVNMIDINFLNIPLASLFVDKFYDESMELRSFTTPGNCDYNMQTKCSSSHRTVRDYAEFMTSHGVPLEKLSLSVSLYGSVDPVSNPTCNITDGGAPGRIPIDYFNASNYNLEDQPVCGSGNVDATSGYCGFTDVVGGKNCTWRTMRESHIEYRVSQLMNKYPSSDFFVMDVSVSRDGYWINKVKQAVSSNLAVSKSALSGGPYYYVGNGPRVSCAGIINYAGNYVVLDRAYDKTVKIPMVSGFLALPGFTCTDGSVSQANTCTQTPSIAVDVATLQTVSPSARRDVVLWDPANLCFVVPTVQQLCSFTAQEGANVDLYQLGTTFTDKPVERDQYWLGISRYVTIADSWTTVIEVMPVNYKCVNFDVTTIPDCLQVLCEGDVICRRDAATVCSMDVASRVAVLGLQQQFYAVHQTYQLMTRELLQYNSGTIDPFTNKANSKFFGLFVSAAALALGIKNSVDIAALQDAMRSVAGLLEDQMKMLNVHDEMLKVLQKQLVSHDQQLVTVQNQFSGQQNQLDGLNIALNATNNYINQLVDATATNAQLSNALQDQLNSQQKVIELINDRVGVNSQAISHNSDRIIKLGNSIANISVALDSNIKAVNGRVTLMEDEINSRFGYVADQLNEIREQQVADIANVNYKINLQAAAMLYYQQLNNLATTLAHNALKLTGMVEAYRTCFKSLYGGTLEGCPVNQKFLADKPYFAGYRSVQGIVYRQDLGVVAVMYKVPAAYRDFAYYTVSAKPLTINGEWFVPRSDDVVMLGDGRFYTEPQCSANICQPPVAHPTWDDCVAAIIVQQVVQIKKYCRLVKCSSDGCTDIITAPIQISGTVTLPERSVGDFSFYNGVQAVGQVTPVPVPKVNIAPIRSSAGLDEITPAVVQVQGVVADLSTSMNQFNAQVAGLQADVQQKLNDFYKSQLSYNLTYEQWVNLVTQIQKNGEEYRRGMVLFTNGSQTFATSLAQWKEQQSEWEGLRDNVYNLTAEYDALRKVYNVKAAAFADQLARMASGDWFGAFIGPAKNIAIAIAVIGAIVGLITTLVGMYFAFRFFCPGVSLCGCCCQQQQPVDTKPYYKRF
ncbi:membrane protein Allo46 [Cyprinid herpesvirus 1]|uniref:Membrane protein Allo46 n=1 Tax=Cyprinid herpesvirus 1 TaxID=317858 RepID=K7PBM0_9VIRU|nr:membrane protein Allo46 [Cyprinid herpesvirus 1]AFJ20396.1 membrane protein Allo46 [Cyprinid herpesvirus 1]